MRGIDERNGALFSYVDVESRIAVKHPLRLILGIVNASLAEMNDAFDKLYSDVGRPSIAPEQLIRGSLLQMLYSIRSERQLMERMEFDLLFRWFAGLSIDERVWDASTFSKNRERLLNGEIAQMFLSRLLARPDVKRLLSSEHFSVDGTLLKAWASMKSFVQKDNANGPPAGPDDSAGRNGDVNFHGQKRSNATHCSTTDKDARLYKKGKGQESRLAYLGHALMENRNGLAIGGEVTHATGIAEREAAKILTKDLSEGATLGADKGYDAEEFVEDLMARKIVPHVAVNGTVSKTGITRKTSVPEHVAASEAYAISQKCRKKIEEIFGWGKPVGGLERIKLRGLAKVKAVFLFTLAAYNLVRLPKLLQPEAAIRLQTGKT